MKKVTIFAVLILILSLAVVPASAQGPGGDHNGRVVMGSNFTVEEGETITDDVVVFGGNFKMKSGSSLEGDLAVFGGNADINGTVDGDIAVIGGKVDIEDDAVVNGDISIVGGNLDVDDDAQVQGTVAQGPDADLDQYFNFGPGFAPDNQDWPNHKDFSNDDLPSPQEIEQEVTRQADNFFTGAAKFVWGGISDTIFSLILGGLAVLVVLFFPSQVKAIETTITRATPISFVVGIVTIPAAAALIFLLTVLVITICLTPVIGFVLAGAMLAGWTVIGKVFGDKIFGRFGNHNPSAASAALLGVTALTDFTTAPYLGELPYIGWMFMFAGGVVGLMVGAIGLGAVVLSRFGVQPYQSSSAPARNVHGVKPEPRPLPPVIDVEPESALDDDAIDEADDPDGEQPAT